MNVLSVPYRVIHTVQSKAFEKGGVCDQMLIQLDFRSSQPIYEQIISQYKYLTLQGYLKPGDAIPSVRKLAMELDVTPGTVAKAYRSMEQQGMIETLRGRGTFIAAVPDKIRDEGVIDKVKNQLREDCMELIYQGMEEEEIVQLIREILENLQGGVEGC